MSSPTSVIRRYTPPTCTLEIAAKDSPLSRWMGQSVLKNLRFKLSFDDPRVSEDQWITVRGDRNQLQALTDAVSHYVQNFLSQSSRFSTQSSIGVAEPVTDFLTQAEQNSAGIHLKPKGLISHELHLGSLANESSGAVLSLSAVQLADLATALDECSADVTTLPNLEKPRWQTVTPAWGTIAAAVIVAVGVTASIARVFEPTAPTQTATSQGASSNDQRLPVQPLPATPAPNTIATLPTAPPPLTTLPPTTTPPAPGISTTPTQPDQAPRLKVAQEAPVSPPPQLEIPIRDVPVPAIPDQTKISQAPSTARSSPSPNAEPVPASSSTETARSIAPAAASLQANPPRPVPAGATIPQVAEVRTYFQKNWKPPQGMIEDIEYRLTLKADGTIDRIEPLGQEAVRLLDASFPVTEQEFVSPIKGGGTPVIRLRLTPKGVVQTFLEAQ
ncbi:DUF4335 domain-containing protein [Leptolyngbya sp. AN03gr2]|uniref:DUF4335 domain-containing protein n=1 Tax=unclassified Leptolyngbya TaxID=2650499 RepID=UPI003D31946F